MRGLVPESHGNRGCMEVQDMWEAGGWREAETNLMRPRTYACHQLVHITVVDDA